VSGWTKKNLSEVKDAAVDFGYAETQESRFAARDLEAQTTGVAYHVVKPGKRQAFAHRHENAEEVHVILSGSGRVKLDDEIVELEPLDALRLAPEVTRQFEAGPDGLTYVVFGPHHDKDGELDSTFWTD
jgi:mannose-6-phosphate isomerase-like protein (cupin superfamily)